MSTITNEDELAQAMGAAELTDAERELVVKTMEETEASGEEAIAAALMLRSAAVADALEAVAPPPQGEPTAKQLKELDKANERHVAAVRGIMGAFVDDFVPCAKCDSMGLEPAAPQPKAHDFFRACGTCNGYGRVLTGSLDEQNADVACPDCGGRGYLEMLLDNTPAVELVKQLRAQRATVQQGDLAPPVAAPQPAPALDVGFGRPAWMGDPTVGQ